MDVVFIGGVFNKGYLAVEFFFIVTGIMMCQTAEKKSIYNIGEDTFSFIKRKILSLMPNYYIAWLITFITVLFCQLEGKFKLTYLMDSYGELFFLRAVGITGIYSNNPTWYISAMLLAEMILYPLLKKWGDFFFYIFAPTTFAILLGVFNHYWGRLNVEEYFGACSSFLLRAIMGILLGSICFKASQNLKKIDSINRFCILKAIIEICIYIFVLLFMIRPIGNYDLLIEILLGINITLTYARTNVFLNKWNNKIFSWMAELSLNLYLSHYAIMKISVYMQLRGWNVGVIYIIGSFINALFIMYFSKFLRYLWKNVKNYRCFVTLFENR